MRARSRWVDLVAIDPLLRRRVRFVVTEAQAVEAMLEFWQDGWEALHPDDPIDPDYVPYTLDNEAMAAVTKWARVTIVNTVRTQTTSGPKGTRRYEQRGRIAVQLFGDVDKGSLELVALGDDVRKVLQGQAVVVADQEIALFEANAVPAGTDGRWNMRLVTVGFMYTAIE